jgi:dTDP-4-amino-4,6-dideoxygalactose transaminase
MMQRIPLSRPCFDEREADAVKRVLAGGWLVQGSEVEAFENGIARLQQARHCIAVSSGTAALHVCFLAQGIGPGDAVFIPSFAWPSAANMAKLVGATPVFVDVLPDTYNMDPRHLEQMIGDSARKGWGKPRAVVPVHEFGLAAEMEKIMAVAARHSLVVVEDAACALGAACNGKPVGTFGSLGIFSFHPRKSITTGEGGGIVTNDDDLADRCRSWRNHGQRIANGRREFVLPGLNYRMTEIQGAIGRVQLGKFPEILKTRRSLAGMYFAQLAGCPDIRLPLNLPAQTWQTFMVVLDHAIDRAKVVEAMSKEGIECGPGSVAGHLGGQFAKNSGEASSLLMCSTELHNSGLALPLYSGMKPEQIDQVCAALRRQMS